jgi:hypothetical protein
MTDKYEDQRFERSCPTCGQEFMAERFDQARSAALEEAARCVMQCNEDQMLSKPEAVEVAAVIRALGTAAAPVPSGWISVKDRLPEVGQGVIAYRPTAQQTSDPTVCVTFYSGREKEDWQGVKHSFDCLCHPSHWMPLPAAPQVPA